MDLLTLALAGSMSGGSSSGGNGDSGNSVEYVRFSFDRVNQTFEWIDDPPADIDIKCIPVFSDGQDGYAMPTNMNFNGGDTYATYIIPRSENLLVIMIQFQNGNGQKSSASGLNIVGGQAFAYDISQFVTDITSEVFGSSGIIQ